MEWWLMPRVVFIVLALFLVWKVVAALGKRKSVRDLGADSYSRFSPRQRRSRLDLDGEAEKSAPEELSECTECGTFIPRERGISGAGDGFFCSRSCRSGYLKRGSRAT